MQLCLKGIYDSEIINQLGQVGVTLFGCDLRPTSFNFTQAYKIKELVEANPSKTYTVIFANEKDFMVSELFKKISSGIPDENIMLEFSGQTPLFDLDKFEQKFCWHYHPNERVINVEKTPNLKRLVLHHTDLEDLNLSGELFGFLSILNSLDKKIEFELQLDWDTSIIESMFDYFCFDVISIEINSKVEKSFRNIDHTLVLDCFKQLSVIIGTNEKEIKA